MGLLASPEEGKMHFVLDLVEANNVFIANSNGASN